MGWTSYLYYKGTSLDYEILCEPKCLYEKYKEGDHIIGNCLIKLSILTNNIEIVLVFCKFEQEKALHMKLEEEIYQENFISYF